MAKKNNGKKQKAKKATLLTRIFVVILAVLMLASSISIIAVFVQDAIETKKAEQALEHDGHDH
jgi:flagellar basal body-associated protein FliL